MNQNRHEIFSYPFERAKEEKDFLTSYLKDINNIGIKSALFKYFPYKLLFKYIGKDIDYVFYNTKNMNLSKSLLPHKSVVLVPMRDRGLLVNEKNLFWFPLNYIAYGVRKIFNTDPLLEKKSSEKIINFTIDFFKLIQPKFLIVWNDSLFIERFLIYCAREAGIKTICIQDGLYQGNSNPIALPGKYADFMYMWSQKQKNIIVEGGLHSSKLAILGYPYKIFILENCISDYDKTKICILGQPWENYNKKLGEKKRLIFNKIVSQFIGIDIAYKPHPNEKDMNYFPDNVRLFTGTLSEAIEEYDYFLSLTSTALIEVALAKKIAIQIYDIDFKCDIFEKEGLSYTYYPLSDITFKEYIEKIDNTYPISEDALFIPKNIGQRFLELEEEIESLNV